MKLHNDNGQTLAQYLGIARQTFSNKLNETRDTLDKRKV